MALTREELFEILRRREWARFKNENPYVPDKLQGDEGFELTAEDEAILDRAWAEIGEREGVRGIRSGVMSDAETLELFGLTENSE